MLADLHRPPPCASARAKAFHHVSLQAYDGDMLIKAKGSPLISCLLTAFLFLAALPATLALQDNLAGIVDWHKPYIGQPLLTPTPPLYIERTNFSGGRVALITNNNVLAAINAENGDIAWRQKLEDNDPVVSFHVQDDTILLLSGPSASSARLFSLSTGHLLWHYPLLPPATSQLSTPVHLGTDAAFVPQQEDGAPATWVILSDGRRVTRLRHDNGQIVWSMDSPSAGSNMVFKQIRPSGNSIHILALHYSFAVQSLLTSTIALDSPIPRGDFGQVPSIVQIPEQAMIASSAEPGGAQVVWFEHGRIRSLLVHEDGSLGQIKDMLPGNGRHYASIIDVGLREQGIVLGKREDGGVEVLDVKEGKKIEEFELSADAAERSESVYSGTITENGVIVNRVYWSFSMGIAVAQTIDIPYLTSADVITSGFTFPYDDLSHGVLLHAAVSPSLDAKHLPSLVLTTSASAILRSQFDSLPLWVREEALADVVAAKFVDLGEPEVEEVREILGEESFVGRSVRHLEALKDLPGYLINFAKRLTGASYSSALHLTPLIKDRLHRDRFGLQKLLVVGTANGKLVALDSSNGQSVWSLNLGLITKEGSEIQVETIDLVKEGETDSPILGVVATQFTETRSFTVAFHVEAYTGKVLGDVHPTTGLPKGTYLFEGVVKEVFATIYKNCGSGIRVLGLVNEKDEVSIWPGCKTVVGQIAEGEKPFYITISNIDSAVLKGYVLAGPKTPESTSAFTSTLLWSRPFTEHERIIDSKPLQPSAIASFGRVLGDKSTLYKYLNPHLLVVSTFTHSSSEALNPLQAGEHVGQGKVYVVDSVSGEVVYETAIEGVKERGGVKVAMVENWLVYSWLSEGGWRIASVEIYEDADKGVTPAVSTFEAQKIQVFAQTFIIPTAIKTLGFTTSKAGITPKELIIINDRNQITSVARRLLDPRRPVGKPSSRDKEEFLIPYDPLIPIDTRKVISHVYPLQGITNILSSPALVESTGLVFGWGQDMFLTRGLSPAGTFDILSDSFNKAQLLLTLGALSAGIMVARPAVMRKMLRMRWH
ncbi:hypothetical protein, variant 3 [Cryptococcus amylolentus CBS 6039]|uniref:ER membrane protein complex subunit 1 n=1 Tax=Cryptococcus amylolentus CBS 6039 TaxID=1295533 RepID=A0A1E3HID5_9TREE|nr:hypothetical protein L202_06371 [Cryptococcus amylolentus CBS 6039]XP_018990820.1 hypothetical protein, variant 1 [Cryptococcus amylolentus CBS 6039]XP_018990821.1 hypothetical protein, variant 2 [Cryptococcus amylolentus CBS 6039]XP_018990822.1 hypothetical protein, variant 3 [Cryptococcus amylolentus CBS 6039]ODN75169.1 hypothetical protein L202_06371 [Cryptococcus amylolentus CBS 6039]ODN75170.1 hypothetical protein, variant 1 [Cryptococcus amylolentus CBS 6039]ODN75171.1 hypothetical p